MRIGRFDWSRVRDRASAWRTRADRGSSASVRAQDDLERRAVHQLQRAAHGRRFPSWKQLTYLPTYLSPTERRIAVALFGIAVLSLGALGWRFVDRHTVSLPKHGGTIVEGLVGTPQFINPILAEANDTDRDLTHLLFTGIVRTDGEQIVPDLARTFEVSEDQKVYTFTLRDDAFWHDGERLTAADVAFTYRSIQDPEFKSPLAPSFAGVTVEAVDEWTVRFTLPEPFTPFLASLTVGILPEHIWAAIPAASANLAELNLKPIGNGPFQFDRLTKESSGRVRAIALRRFDGFYGMQPYLDEVSFKFYPDIQAATEALKNRNIESLAFIPKELKDDLAASNPRVAFHSLRLPQYTAIFFNQKKRPALKDLTIRRALEFAVDKKRIIDEALQDEGQIIHSPILPGFLGHNEAIQGLAYDAAEAERTLDEADWKRPDGGEVAYRTKDDETLQLTLTAIDQPEQRRTAEILKELWDRVGFEITLNLVSTNQVQSKVIKPRDYEILLFGEVVGLDPDPYPFWHSSQAVDPGLNLALFANADVDQLLEEARQTNDTEQRRLKYLHLQNIIAGESPAIFLYNPFYTYGIDERVRGVGTNYITTPADRFQGIRDWYIHTKTEWR